MSSNLSIFPKYTKFFFYTVGSSTESKCETQKGSLQIPTYIELTTEGHYKLPLQLCRFCLGLTHKRKVLFK